MNTALATSFSLVALALSGGTSQAADAVTAGRHALSVKFEPRVVEQVEVGDFHFAPGQVAPIHTHAAPAIGYVSKGTIFYQVEGQKPQILRAGDVFYEPVGPRIMHFDNHSRTEPAVFTDFNLQQKGEPFIVFPKPLTAKIDRRPFQTAQLGGILVGGVEADSVTLEPGGTAEARAYDGNVLGYVAEGAVRLTFAGEEPVTFIAGQTFHASANRAITAVGNASAVVPTTLVNFHLRNATRAALNN